MKRITSIDLTRGIVMIIMALDHVRDLIYVNATQNPTIIATTTPALFFTRWITHLCAPTFVFLAGVSAYRYLKKRDDLAQTRSYLLTRGFWLIIVDFTFLNFGMFFDAGFHTLLFEVISAIGFGFIILSLLISLPSKTIGIIGLVIICCHNLLPLIPFSEGSAIRAFLQPLFAPAVFLLGTGRILIWGYPPVPWLGVLLAGFGTGNLFELPDNIRVKRFLQIGGSALLLFVVVRVINIYGDPLPWASQKDNVYTFLSFMNVTKYPPSLLFCLATLGITFLMLALTEQITGRWTNAVLVYGRVPLFYFVVHFYLIHIILLIILFAQGFTWSQLDFSSGALGRPKDAASGVSLGMVYLYWIAVVLIMYLPCRWFGQYKATHSQRWLKYL